MQMATENTGIHHPTNSKENQYFELCELKQCAEIKRDELWVIKTKYLRFKMDFLFSIKKLNSMIFYSSLFSSKTSKKADQETYLARHSFHVNVHFIVHSQFI